MKAFLACLLFALCLAGALSLPSRPKKGSGQERVHDSQPSSEDHHQGESDHNKAYDHDAFLGSDEAKQFEKLTPEESRERLRYSYSAVTLKSVNNISCPVRLHVH